MNDAKVDQCVAVPARATPAASLARRVAAAMAGLETATPTAAEVAEAIGESVGRALETLRLMECGGWCETWPDPALPHVTRVMISARAAKWLGLVANSRGDRWSVPAGVASIPLEDAPDVPDPRAPPPKRGRPVTKTDPNPFAWVRERNARRAALAMTLRALRSGWAMAEADRDRLRSEMEWLRDDAGLRDRERPTVAGILALLDGRDEPPRPRLRRDHAGSGS